MADGVMRGESSISGYSLLGVLQRQDFPRLLPKFGNNTGTGELMIMAEIMGATSNVSMEELFWFEEPYIDRYGTSITTVGATAPGASVTITLDAASHGPNGQSGFLVDDVVRVDAIGTTSTYAQARITAITATVNANVLTLEPRYTTTDFGAAGTNPIVAGTVISRVTNSMGEGSDARDALTVPPVRYQTYWHIARNTVKSTGSMMGAENRVNMGGGAGAFQYKYDIENNVKRHMSDIDQQLMFGQRPTTTTAPSSFDGLETRVLNGGGFNPAYGGVINTAFWDGMNLELDRRGSPNKYMLFTGSVFQQQLENWVSTDFKDGAIVWFSADGKMTPEMSIELNQNFKSFTKGGRQFVFRKYGGFTQPQLAGAPGFRYQESAIAIPNGTFVDRKTSETFNNFHIYYKKMGNGIVRKANAVETGRNAPMPTNQIDSNTWDLLTEFSGQFSQIEQYAWIKPY